MSKKTNLKAGYLPCFFLAVFSFLSLFKAAATGIPGKFFIPPIEQSITGKVTDAVTGSPLVGASISIKGSRKNTITDAGGNYTITVANENVVLVFSFVGYTGQQVVVKNQSTIDVALSPSTSDLAGGVVVGYGT